MNFECFLTMVKQATRSNALVLFLTMTCFLLMRRSPVDAFHFHPIDNQRSLVARHPRTRRTSKHSATIYYPDDGDSNSSNNNKNVNTEDDHSQSFLHRSNFLHDEDESSNKVPDPLRSPTWTAPLARLASGHTPGLKLEQIDHVSVRSVQPSNVDIEAIVCEYDGCVSLSVPVMLPTPCNSRDDLLQFENCILENLHALDQAATANALSPEELAKAEQLNYDLHCPEATKYPEWWISSSNVQLKKQCEGLQNVLNEPDFRHELRNFVVRQIGGEDDDEEDLKVGPVACVAIGTAGMIVRATVMNYGNNTLVGMFEVPVPFPASSVEPEFEDIRNHVLDLVEGV